ncbi:MAG: glycogen debranching enzyme family protein [Deltaproteobacteria bacterium]|nr:glycogen debranching enzyme family protein [Deltaproteobacteria bacterium]
MPIELDSEALSDLARAARLEWLETNGKGGFAASTVVGANTRRYHGLLIAALSPPLRRHVLVSRLEEVIEPEGRGVDLATNFYPGAVHPRGYRLLSSFRLDPFPIFTYWAGERGLEKAVFLVGGEDTVVVRYTLFAGPPCFLQVRPFVAFRDYHALTHKNDAIDRRLELRDGTVSIRPYDGLPALRFHHRAREVIPHGDWWLRQQYPREAERGLDFEEDLYSPFALRFELSTGASVFVVASLDRESPPDAPALEQRERRRRAEVVAAVRRAAPGLDERLALAADAFVVDRTGGGRTVVAGYPWFTDWGRDTMISLPGLCLATGRLADARAILVTFARAMDGGMIPNRFPDAGQPPEYNNVDGTLWFVRACGQYVAASGDRETARSVLLPALLEVVRRHRAGTRYGIRVDADGLLRAGDASTQLTWMDAKVGDWVVTPRAGKPVEVQALWIDALETTADLARDLGAPGDARECADLARLARESFARRFWYVEGGYLYDVVDGPDGRDDAALRPNQIFAVAVPRTPLVDDARCRSLLGAVERELVTPCGLRTLSPRDRRYAPRYGGDPRARDGAYHQGTVWPWLIGPYASAWLRVHGRTPGALGQARALVAPLLEHLAKDGVGQVPELFDADPPHAPGGCTAQAWSVAELVRLLAGELR